MRSIPSEATSRPALLLSVLLAGCFAANTPGEVGLDGFPQRLASATCDALTRCGSDTVHVYELLASAELLDCEAQLGAVLEHSDHDRIRAGVADGSILYNPARAAECVEQFRSICQPSASVDDCDDVFEGQLADGEPCSIEEQCAAHGVCDTVSPDMCPPGVCAHPFARPIGGVCTEGYECARDLHCAVDGICRDREPDGSPCEQSTPPACLPGSACVPVDGMMRCAPATLGQSGDDCSFVPCGAGLHCNSSTMQCETPLAGGPCQATVYGSFGCPQGQGCDVASGPGRCVPLPTLGQPCRGVCTGGSRCVEGTCAIVLNIGDVCSSDGLCISRFCDGGRCARQPLCRAP